MESTLGDVLLIVKKTHNVTGDVTLFIIARREKHIIPGSTITIFIILSSASDTDSVSRQSNSPGRVLYPSYALIRTIFNTVVSIIVIERDIGGLLCGRLNPESIISEGAPGYCVIIIGGKIGVI